MRFPTDSSRTSARFVHSVWSSIHDSFNDRFMNIWESSFLYPMKKPNASNGSMLPLAPLCPMRIKCCILSTETAFAAGLSAIGWSGNALKGRLDRLLPHNRFVCILTSSDYGIRKPHPFLFELALRKADLPAENVWFCGDHPQKDVEGASHVGIFPVWYDNATEREYQDRSDEAPPKCRYLYIREWTEMIDVLQKLAP